ncbi:MAG: GTP-binding protein [Anaerolineae bacterium]|nr:GTP-binding protein [Anaerolineae bacterium]
MYNYDLGAEAENWDLEWNHPSSEVDEYGFSSFAFRCERPLVWFKFDTFLNSPLYDQVIRSKGIVYFNDHAPVIISQAGSLCQLDELEALPADVPALDEPEISELVFIGQGLPAAAILAELEACKD